MRFPRPFARPVLAGLVLAVLAAAPVMADPRPREPMDAGGIAHELRRLRSTATVLHVAAHPDDENTALLAWLTHVKGARTAYLSLTRGDGGQNLIGPELGPPLGVIRTQELLAARRTDGAEQWFTRALDFGFSKNTDETLRLWGRDSVLADVVWVIRSLRPDVIVTRFPPDSTAGHGHHSASGLLAEEAFEAAADPTRFPEQLAWVRPWRAKRLAWNVFSFGRVTPDSSWVAVDVGAYEPLLGRSMNELAATSRSHHRSQGFGSAERRGTSLQYLRPRLGTPARRDPFDDVETGWRRFPGGEAVTTALDQAERAYDPRHPERVLPWLARVHAALAKLPDEPIVRHRRSELEHVMASCAGLWAEATSTRPSVVPGDRVTVATSILARTSVDVVLESVVVAGQGRDSVRTLVTNRALADTFVVATARDLAVTQPYWLRQPPTRGLSHVAERADLGAPEDRPVLTAEFRLRIAGTPVRLVRTVAYRWTDRVEGERWRRLEVTPPASLAFDAPFRWFGGAASRAVRVTVRAERDGAQGVLRLEVPAGWTVTPDTVPVAIPREAGERAFEFRVTPGSEGGEARAVFRDAEGRDWSHAVQRLDHTHIPLQTLHPAATLTLVRGEPLPRSPRVGWVAGSGDPLDEALRQMGAAVTALSDDDLASGDLSRFDVIVTGVRAHNTRPRLRALQPRLLEWVASGGRLVMQYVTNTDGVGEGLGPRPFRVSRERVTVEDAPVAFRVPAHPLLRSPYALGPRDFDGWVQERGLYFASPFDAGYDAPLSSNDPGEPARDGGLLYARHGKGEFVYCAYALFRQIPAGVPGAWRLLGNLASPVPAARP